MHLVPASFKREAFAVVLVLLLGGAVCLAAAADSSARPTTPRWTTVVPDGSYGVDRPARGEYIVFTVRNRKVRDLNLQIQVTCQASDTPYSEQRFFTAGAVAPQGRTVPANGKLILNWQERGNGRLGQVHVELRFFGPHDLANIGVIVPEEPGPEAEPEEAKESCDGVGALPFRRGFELRNLPPAPNPS
jgi:hypothetical protein